MRAASDNSFIQKTHSMRSFHFHGFQDKKSKSPLDILFESDDVEGLLKVAIENPKDRMFAATGVATLCASKGWTRALSAVIASGMEYRDFDCRGMTCVHQAAINGGPDCVRVILSAWPDAPFSRNGKDGATPFSMACRFSQDETAAMLWRPGIHATPDEDGLIPADTAFACGMQRTCELIARNDPVFVLSKTLASMASGRGLERLACSGMNRPAIASMFGRHELSAKTEALAMSIALQTTVPAAACQSPESRSI